MGQGLGCRISSCQPLWEVGTSITDILLRRKPVQRRNELAQGLVGNNRSTWDLNPRLVPKGEFLSIGWYCLSCHH